MANTLAARIRDLEAERLQALQKLAWAVHCLEASDSTVRRAAGDLRDLLNTATAP